MADVDFAGSQGFCLFRAGIEIRIGNGNAVILECLFKYLIFLFYDGGNIEGRFDIGHVDRFRFLCRPAGLVLSTSGKTCYGHDDGQACQYEFYASFHIRFSFSSLRICKISVFIASRPATDGRG